MLSYPRSILLFSALVSLSVWAGSSPHIETTIEADALIIETTDAVASYRVVVVGPFERFEYQFSGGKKVHLASGEFSREGFYKFEITAVPIQRGKTVNPRTMVASGVFTIQNGGFVTPISENRDPVGEKETQTRDAVVNDDQIVTGSLCVGGDCADGENFGNDTLRLKDEILRLTFQDTSNTSFPDNDWQLTINDDTSGGADKFSIEDVSGSTTPLTIEAGAASHAIYVDDVGNVGLGTSTPVDTLHLVDSDTPLIRLEQSSAGGQTPQAWDVAGDEVNFSVSDTTDGTTPFAIETDAPDNAFYMDEDGNIGLGHSSPTAHLDIKTSDGTAQLRIEDTEDVSDTDPLLYLSDYVQTKIGMHNRLTDKTFEIIAGPSGFNLSNTLTSDAEFTIKNDNTIRMGANKNNYFVMTPTGDVTISQDLTVNGTFSAPSDVNLKEEFEAVDPTEVLEKLVALPITTWTYRHDETASRHMGVMAQDFYAAFGLGGNDRYLTSIDPDGVAMAAIQGLDQKVAREDARLNDRLDQKETRIGELETENAALEARVAKLEALVRSLLEQQP